MRTRMLVVLLVVVGLALSGCDTLNPQSPSGRAALGGAVLGGVGGAAIGSGTGAVVAGSAVGAGGGYYLGKSAEADSGYVNTSPVYGEPYAYTPPSACGTCTRAALTAPVPVSPVPVGVMERVETRSIKVRNQ